MGSLVGATEDENFAIAGEFIQSSPEFIERNIDRSWHTLHRQLLGMAHIKQGFQYTSRKGSLAASTLTGDRNSWFHRIVS
jgi:hypothetical protein